MKTESTYDLVVFINVLEHCFDVDLAFATLKRSLAPRGILVFCDKLYECASVENRLPSQYDDSHPLLVDHAVIEKHLAAITTPLYSEVKRFSSRVENRVKEYEALY